VEVLDRYLQAVRSWLPPAQKDDVVAELEDDLRSQIDEEEAALGRPLGAGELEGLLRRRGHPMWVAEPFADPDHLIGPVLLPLYRRVLKVALAGLGAIFSVMYVVFGLVAPDLVRNPALGSLSFWAWYACLYGFALAGLLTLIFAVLERSQARARSAGTWDPRHPEALPHVPEDPEAAYRQRVRVSAAGDAFGDALLTLCWLGLLRLPRSQEVTVSLAPVFDALYWPVLLVLLGGLALAVATLIRPRRSRLVNRLSLACNVAGLVLVGVALAAGHWVDVAIPGAPAERLATLARWLDRAALYSLIAVGLAYLWSVVSGLRRMFGTPHATR
jgi:hypothetical protein